MQASDVARSGRYGCCSSESHDGSAGRPHDSGGSRDARSAGAVTEIIIAGGPVRTDVPGQWRILLNETPSAAWRDRLLELAAADPVTAAFRIEVEGTILPGGFSCLRRSGAWRRGGAAAGAWLPCSGARHVGLWRRSCCPASRCARYGPFCASSVHSVSSPPFRILSGFSLKV